MHILMNNCYANYGSTNARELGAMLEAELSTGVGDYSAEAAGGSKAGRPGGAADDL